MLIVRRRAGESIAIGNGIEVEILEIGPLKVKIGVRAPAEVPVQRKEMVRVSEHNRQAAMISNQSKNVLVENLAHYFSKTGAEVADKSFEARYSGHPETEENLEPA